MRRSHKNEMYGNQKMSGKSPWNCRLASQPDEMIELCKGHTLTALHPIHYEGRCRTNCYEVVVIEKGAWKHGSPVS